MKRKTLLALVSMVLSLALAPPAMADRHVKTHHDDAAQAERAHPPPAQQSPPGIPRGNLRGDIASHAHVRDAPAPAEGPHR